MTPVRQLGRGRPGSAVKDVEGTEEHAVQETG